MPKEPSHYISIISIDSVFKTGKNYYSEVFFIRIQIHFQGIKNKQMY